LFKLDVIVILGRHVFKDRLGFDDLELGLEVFSSTSVARRVAATAGVRHIVRYVYDLLTRMAPVSLASTLFLDFLGVGIDKASFGKEFWDMLGRASVVGVVTISELVATSHVE
jgi:hypothetical protein